MSDREHAQLILRGYELPLVESNIGFINATATNLTWKNINLRTLLGAMYDKYDTFNLTIKYIGTSKATSLLNANYGNSDPDNLNVCLNINGLPFINQTYMQSHGCNATNAILGIYTFPATVTTSQQCFYSSNYLTFGKYQELVNINIYYTRVADGLIPVTITAFPEIIFILDIFGIDKPVNNINGTRMNISSSR